MKNFVMLACWFLLAEVAVAKIVIDDSPPHVSDPVDDLYLQGNYAQSHHNYDYALACWDRVLRLQPDDATAWFNRAVALDCKGETDKALDSLDHAIRLDPKDPAAYEFRGKLHVGKSSGAFSGAMFDNAVADYNHALELELRGVDDPKAWLLKKSAASENSIQALVCCDAVIKLDPKDARAYVPRAGVHQLLRENERALADYATAIQLDPKLADAYYGRVTLDKALGDRDKTLADLTQALQLAPTEQGYDDRVAIYLKLQQWDKALADYTSIIAFHPDYGWVWHQRAELRYRLKDWDNAISDLDKAYEFYTKRNDGQADNALQLRGGAFYHKRQWEKALADFNKLAVSSPTDWQGREAAAWIYATCPDEKFRDGAKAVQLASEACELNHWNDDSEIDVLAAAYAEAGKWDDAIATEKKAITLHGSSPTENDDMTDHLKLYQQKKPCREEREPLLWWR